jgi:hypothetical protein
VFPRACEAGAGRVAMRSFRSVQGKCS